MTRLLQIILGIATLLLLPSAALVAINVLVVDPLASATNLTFTLIQAGIVLVVLRFSPLWPKGAHWMWPIACIAWGAIGSVGLSVIIAMPTTEVVLKLGWKDLVYSFAGAYPEELTKAIGVLMILASFRGMNRPWHGLATGMLVGMAFDVFENFGYAGQGALTDPDSDLLGVAITWGFRTVFGPGLHMMFTGFVGFGIGLAVFTLGRSMLWRIGVATFWFLFGFASHFVWNLVIGQSLFGIIFAVLVAYPTFISVIVTSWRQARRDTGYLTVELTSGYSPRYQAALPSPQPQPAALPAAPTPPVPEPLAQVVPLLATIDSK